MLPWEHIARRVRPVMMSWRASMQGQLSGCTVLCAVRWVAAWLVKGRFDVNGAGAVTSCKAYTWHSAHTAAVWVPKVPKSWIYAITLRTDGPIIVTDGHYIEHDVAQTKLGL